MEHDTLISFSSGPCIRTMQDSKRLSLFSWPLSWNCHCFHKVHTLWIKNWFNNWKFFFLCILWTHWKLSYKSTSKPIFINHIRSHSGSHVPVALGNESADHLTVLIFNSPVEDHNALHTNAYDLHAHYCILPKQVRQIVCI